VPLLPTPTRTVLEAVGMVTATSANLTGGADPCRLADIPPEIRAGVAVALDAGDLPGVPSTVIDLTGAEPVILREGAVSAADAIARATIRRR
jgi:L-threonylcarbamoyladenylate synthase